MFVLKKNEQKVDHQPDEERPNSFASAACVANSGQHKEHAPVGSSRSTFCAEVDTREPPHAPSVPLIQLPDRDDFWAVKIRPIEIDASGRACT